MARVSLLPPLFAHPSSSPGPIPGFWFVAECGSNFADYKLHRLLVHHPMIGAQLLMKGGLTDQWHLSSLHVGRSKAGRSVVGSEPSEFSIYRGVTTG